MSENQEQTLAHERESLETASSPDAPDATATAALPQLTAVDRERYELGLLIAAGGGGRISAAQDVRLARTVAIKRMHENVGPAKTDRFAREALLTARLQHPNRLRGRDGLRAQRECDPPRPQAANVLVGSFGETVVIDWGHACRGHGAHVEDVDMVAGHPRMVSGSTDGTVRIWDIESGEHRQLAHHDDAVLRVISRPDRGEVVSVARNGAVRRWRDDVPHERAELRRWLGPRRRTPPTSRNDV